MDTQAHLLNLGWAGPGHALDALPYKQKGHRGLAYDPKTVRSTGGNGLVKPLLISQRQSRLGVGRKAHEPAAGDQWWLAGFEKALGNVGKSYSERTSGASTPVLGEHSGKHGGLYGFFVKGQSMEGTFGQEQPQLSNKRKIGEMLGLKHRDGDAAELQNHRENVSTEFGMAQQFMILRDKDRTLRERRNKQDPVVDFERIGQFFKARSGQGPCKSNEPGEEASLNDLLKPATEHESERNTAKKARRERRRQRREKKAAQANAEVNIPVRPPPESFLRAEAMGDYAVKKAASKAERKRRKKCEQLS